MVFLSANKSYKATTESVFKSAATKKLMEKPVFRVMFDGRKKLLKIAEEIGARSKQDVNPAK
ncbi:MAG TPA: hypothetical protein PLB12_11730 [Candidatus Goldiibacteriota bacterium]|nr:hypothetical protein [Candidatus Goldiibacteriota bacterium]HRQ45006.1 hypothetical protein [Candidatus Goldiibacteriota bacterium]